MENYNSKTIMRKLDELESKLEKMEHTSPKTLTAGSGISISNNTISANVDLSGKQDVLTAGEGITIENNVISASGGQGLTQEQATQLERAYNYFLTHVVEPDQYYTPKTYSDFPAGTIVQTYDYYERDFLIRFISSVNLPKVFFCTEQASLGMVNVSYDLLVDDEDMSIEERIYLNDTLISTDTFLVANNTRTRRQKSLQGIEFSPTSSGNIIYISLKTNSYVKYSTVYNQKIEIIAPNALVLNNPCVFNVDYFDGKYYIADCTNGNIKLAEIECANMFNMSNLTFNNLNIQGQNFSIGRNTTNVNSIYEYNDMYYVYTSLDNYTKFYSVNLDNTLSQPFYETVSWYFTSPTSSSYTYALYPNKGRKIIIPTNNGAPSTGNLVSLYSNVVKCYSAKPLFQNNLFPLVYTLIQDNGDIHLCYSTNTVAKNNFYLGKGTSARVYFTQLSNATSFKVSVFVKRFEKIIRYDMSYNSSNGYVVDTTTELGSYDDFWLGIGDDYFTLKNGVLSFHKISENIE